MSGDGISVYPTGGPATNPSSACANIHDLALDVNKTSWYSYDPVFSNRRNPNNCDMDQYTCTCSLHPNEGLWTFDFIGDPWGLVGSYNPSVPPTSTGW